MQAQHSMQPQHSAHSMHSPLLGHPGLQSQLSGHSQLQIQLSAPSQPSGRPKEPVQATQPASRPFMNVGESSMGQVAFLDRSVLCIQKCGVQSWLLQKSSVSPVAGNSILRTWPSKYRQCRQSQSLGINCKAEGYALALEWCHDWCHASSAAMPSRTVCF